jgi:hypothetical protein
VDVEGESVKPGVTSPPVTVRVMGVLAVVLPEAPVMVTVLVPAVAALLAISVSTLEVADEAGLNEAVTPLGSPVAVNDAAPLNPPDGLTVIVLAVLEL